MRTVCLAFLAVVTLPVTSLSAQAESAGKMKTFRDCPECPEMVEIPAGSFIMGVPPEEEGYEAGPEIVSKKISGRAVPQHKVTLSAFALGKYDVTVAEYRAFVSDTGYTSGDECEIYGQDPEKRWRMVHGNYSWRDPGFPQTDRHPAVCISWDDAKAYVAWLSKKTGHAYHLPSEAQWEYAARAGTQTRWYWGSDRNEGCKYANVGDQTLATKLGPHWFFNNEAEKFQCSDGHAHASPVGTYKPNAFGLYDMLGNVFQWVEDCINPSYEGAPADGSAWITGRCDRRFLRGGSWTLNSHVISSGFRASNTVDNKESTHGLRVARTK